MPSIYTFDNSAVRSVMDARVTAITHPSTAFHKNAPKSINNLGPVSIPHETVKIYMPRNEDHGWGHHIARTSMEVHKRTTPFNNRIKGDQSTHFKCPVGKLGVAPGAPENSEPRTEFMVRVKRIIDALSGLMPNSYGLAFARALYANLNDRMPNSVEIANIVELEIQLAGLLNPANPRGDPEGIPFDPYAGDPDAGDPDAGDPDGEPLILDPAPVAIDPNPEVIYLNDPAINYPVARVEDRPVPRVNFPIAPVVIPREFLRRNVRGRIPRQPLSPEQKIDNWGNNLQRRVDDIFDDEYGRDDAQVSEEQIHYATILKKLHQGKMANDIPIPMISVYLDVPHKEAQRIKQLLVTDPRGRVTRDLLDRFVPDYPMRRIEF